MAESKSRHHRRRDRRPARGRRRCHRLRAQIRRRPRTRHTHRARARHRARLPARQRRRLDRRRERGLEIGFATEETTSGGNRLKRELAGRVGFPVVVIDDSSLKRLIENQYGVGPTVVEGFMRATNLLVAATTFAVVGYGACGRGVARALRADGATVIVVELDPVRALEAAFDGMRVLPLADALPQADAVITVTGTTGVVRADELALLRDGALLANAGHFSELELPASYARRRLTELVEEVALPSGRAIRLLGRGEMLNLTGATGNQIQVMDLGFALQAHSLRALARDASPFVAGPQPVPRAIDEAIGRAMLASLSASR